VKIGVLTRSCGELRIFSARDAAWSYDSVLNIAGAVLVLLGVAKAILRESKFLPLGGSDSSQMAIILGLAFVVHEVLGVLH
jgi:hypothetical protein